MTASAILAARGLPTTPQDTAALGRWLRRHPDLFVVPQGNMGKVGGRRLVRLTDEAWSLSVSVGRPAGVQALS